MYEIQKLLSKCLTHLYKTPAAHSYLICINVMIRYVNKGVVCSRYGARCGRMGVNALNTIHTMG